MGQKTNKLLVSGVIGAFGVVGVTQVPSVQAAMSRLEQNERPAAKQAVSSDPVHQALQALVGDVKQPSQKQAKSADTKQVQASRTEVRKDKSAQASDVAIKQQAQAAAKAASVEAQADLVQSENAHTEQVASVETVSATKTAASEQATDASHVTASAVSESTVDTDNVVATPEAEASVNVTPNATELGSQAPAVSESTSVVTPQIDQDSAAVAEAAPTSLESTVDATPVITPEVTTATGAAMAQAAVETQAAGNVQTSGQLVAQAYQQATGQNIPENTTQQEAYFNLQDLNGAPLQDVAKQGDVVFWGNHGTSYQAGVYVGQDQVITGTQANTDAAPSFVGSID
ncbi:NlpC/P60 family protein [Weissella viridescens]|uniref:NlpC/P60 family protein n=1 Tax=Weissella viridescens TaxID=1629 RepID=UPI002578361D|nr:NlpC/P60 family protein [Weissella viridescens]WJI91717.1 NlpC/P60 family protein [Weissella viridescens]